MSDSFTIKVEVPRGIDRGAVLLSEEVNTALRNAGVDVERRAKSLAPQPADEHWGTGHLRRSISALPVVPLGGKPTQLVVAQAHYARYVEFGTKPHTPPLGNKENPSALYRWAVNNGISPGAVWMTIRRRGTKAHPFMRPAFAATRKENIDRVKRGIAKAIERMGNQ